MFSRENREASGLAVWWVILGFALVMAASFGYLFLLKPMMNLETQANRASFQYTDTKQRQLLMYISQYETLDADIASVEGQPEVVAAKKAQQRALYNRIKAEAALIDPSQVPNSVKVFLLQNGQ